MSLPVMSKRSAPEINDDAHQQKRARLASDRLSSLSDELLLRVLSYLPIQDLNICQTVSRRLQEIAADLQLWKAAYYERFVRPRVLLLPGRKTHGLDPSLLAHSSRLSRWLDEGNLVKRGTTTNWKRQYKIRHNWSKGACDVKQIPVTNRPPMPPLLARLHSGVVYTVDSISGLRAWSYKSEKKLLASTLLESPTEGKCSPISFAIDTNDPDTIQQRMVIGYDSGGFSIYTYMKLEARFRLLYTHPSSSNGLLSAVALTMPYVLTMTENQVLSLYNFGLISNQHPCTPLQPPRLLASLKSHTIWPPVSLALRSNGHNIVASIAYCLPTYSSDWSVGIQELHVAPNGSITSSRLASAVPQGFIPLTHEAQSITTSRAATPQPQENSPSSVQPCSKPTSISYSHPYILVSHSNNTLTLYLATSTGSCLSISSGKRLFGHTSAVFSAHVGVRGKAVSVGLRGGPEVRVWELEGVTLGHTGRSRTASENLSVQLIPDAKLTSTDKLNSLSNAINQRGTGLGLALNTGGDEWSVTRGWVGFDEENLIILRDQKQGGQALAVYDFS